MKISYRTKGTCSSEINLEVDENGKIVDAEIVGGCPGNTEAVCRLIKGRDAREVADLLRGTPCGMRGTSCPDQLAKAIDKMYENQ